MTVRTFQPNADRPLTRSERERLHTAIIEAEFSLDDLPGWIPDDWIRILQAPVQASFARSGCYSVHLMAYENKRLREYRASLWLEDDAPRRWWHRFTDWWWKW